MTEAARALRQLLDENRAAIDAVLDRYGARDPQVFGSVARGDARSDSDIDLVVDLSAGVGNALMRVAGIGQELSDLLGVRVDVVADELLREPVSASSLADRVAL